MYGMGAAELVAAALEVDVVLLLVMEEESVLAVVAVLGLDEEVVPTA